MIRRGISVDGALGEYIGFPDEVAFLIQLAKFALTVAGSIVLKYLGTYLLEHHVGIDYKIGKLIADLFVSVLFNYPLQRFWVFHKTRP